MAPIFIGSLIQMFVYGVSLAWLGSALGITALFISLQQQKVYKDELTGLYNRLYLNHILYKMNRFSNRHYYGLMMDLNDFKQINDTYGHSMGDIALVEIAKIFRSIINDDCFAFRYAGDEFIILMKTNRLEDVLELESTITEKLKDYNTTSSYPFQLSVSIGHGEYDNEHDTEDSFLKKIDSAMYEAKKIYHANDGGHFA
jgi:diguanylate cyclase (GGDEF)-like protein